MSALTSEQAITAIEHSSKSTLELLDDAATVIRLDLSGDAHDLNAAGHSNLNIDVPKFREQWILRWIIKKLGQAVNSKQTSDDARKQLLSDVKTWRLLNHLLASIPKHASKAIILERGLCNIFSQCLETCTTIADAELPAGGLPVPSFNHFDLDNCRPSKKRKISNSQNAPQYGQPPHGIKLLFNVLRVAGKMAEALLAVDVGQVPHRRSMPSNWTSDIDDAAAFVARLVHAANVAKSVRPKYAGLEGKTVIELENLLEQWIDLWQASATAAQSHRKQTPALAFINHALVPALDFLGTASTNYPRSLTQALERQIAAACVLPMRATFQKQFVSMWDSANTWGTGETEPQWAKIQKAMEALTSHVGEAAAGFRSSEGEKRMATILSLASRITPTSELVRRRADRSWMEALYLCLCLLLSKSAPGHETIDGDLKMPADTSSVDAHLPLPIFASSVSLDALQATRIEISTRFWQFYLRYALSGSEAKIPIETLTKMVGTNASVFVPEREDAELSLLKTFCAALNEDQCSNHDSVQLLLKDILAPIWEDFGKRKRLDVLIQFWESRLLDTFHLRSTSTAERHPAQIWDHPDLLDIFSSVCQRYAQPSICIDTLETVKKDIARLADIVGPTHEIFARIIILGSMLKVMGNLPSVQQLTNDQKESVHDLVCKALYRKTDYQGHRWRLWKILETFVQLSPIPLATADLPKLELSSTQLPFTQSTDFDSQLTQMKPQLMENFQSFSCSVSLYENRAIESEAVFITIMGSLNDLLQMYRRYMKTPNRMLQHWDGLSETMDSVFKLLSACLARVAGCSRTWYSSQTVPDNFLRTLASVSFGQSDEEGFTALSVAAEAILAQVASSTRIDLMDPYLNALSKRVTAQSAPPLLHALAQGAASEHQAQKLCIVLFDTMKTIDPHSNHEPFLHYLSLATEIIMRHTGPALSVLDLTSYIQFLEVGTYEATTEQLAAAYQFIQRTAQLMLTLPTQTLPDSKTKPIREELLKWTKKQIEKIEISDEAELLNKYTGYLVLMVSQSVHDIDTSTATKKEREYIDHIKEHHPVVVIDQCMMLVDEESEDVDFWPILVLLDSLVHAEAHKTVYKRMQKCLQKVVQAVVAASGANSEDISSIQQTRAIAKLWDALSKLIAPDKSQAMPEFPHASFAHKVAQQENQDALVLQAQLATKHQSRNSLVLLAKTLRLAKIVDEDEHPKSAPLLGSESYLPVAAAIRGLKLDDTSASTDIIVVLGQIAGLQTAVDETSPSSLIIRLELSKMVLDKHSSIVNQHVIDSTLTSIMNLASSASRAITTKDSTEIEPEHIFDRLCMILSTLLIRYRRRLTGRHHLVLPALRNLLQCLFYTGNQKNTPTSSPSKHAHLTSLPPWLNPPTHTGTLTLPASSATKFSRLLQQLCDPSASSARHVSKRPRGANVTATANDNLTDDVKSLRREVSRHTQYLLQTYCQVMLDGYIAPDVKEKLLPGLYAAMNAMDVEVMRALNAAMDASQRAIWKDLYADWRRFGRWNQR